MRLPSPARTLSEYLQLLECSPHDSAFKANPAHKSFAENIKTVLKSLLPVNHNNLIPFKFGQGVNILGWLET